MPSKSASDVPQSHAHFLPERNFSVRFPKHCPRHLGVKDTEMLTHITLNDSRETHLIRSAVVEPLVGRLRSTLTADATALSDDGAIRLVQRCATPPGADFSITVFGLLVMTCYACWAEAESEVIWRAAEDIFLNLAEFDLRLDTGWRYREKPEVPWCATIFFPHFMGVAIDHRDQIDLIRPCLVWAFMELATLSKDRATALRKLNVRDDWRAD